MLALRRAPGARSLSAVFDRHFAVTMILLLLALAQGPSWPGGGCPEGSPSVSVGMVAGARSWHLVVCSSGLFEVQKRDLYSHGRISAAQMSELAALLDGLPAASNDFGSSAPDARLLMVGAFSPVHRYRRYRVGDELEDVEDRGGLEAVIRLAEFVYDLLPRKLRANVMAPWRRAEPY